MRSVFQVLAVGAALAAVSGLHTLDNEKSHDKRQQEIGVAFSGIVTRGKGDFQCTRDAAGLIFMKATRKKPIGTPSGGSMMRREAKTSRVALLGSSLAKKDEPDSDSSDSSDGGFSGRSDDVDDSSASGGSGGSDGGSASGGSDDGSDEEKSASLSSDVDSDDNSNGGYDAKAAETTNATAKSAAAEKDGVEDASHTEGTGVPHTIVDHELDGLPIRVDGDDDDPNVPNTGSHGCKEDYVVDGNWCEETCTDPEAPLSKAISLCTGTCNDQGYQVGMGVLKVAWFAADSSTFPSAGNLILPAGCDAYHVIKHDMCEAFCVLESQSHFAASRTGIVKGTCSDSGYPKFLAHGMVTFNTQSGTIAAPTR